MEANCHIRDNMDMPGHQATGPDLDPKTKERPGSKRQMGVAACLAEKRFRGGGYHVESGAQASQARQIAP